MENGTQDLIGGVGSVEVLFAWRDATGNRAVIDAELVEPSRCPAVWVGAHQGQRFVVPMELAQKLGEGERFRLVGIEDGRFVLRVPEGADLVATLKGELVELPLGIDRVRTVALSAEHVAEVRLGDFSFYVRPGAAPEKAADRGPLLDWRAARWGLAAFAAHALFVGSFFFAPPNASALNIDLDSSAHRYVQVQLAAIAQEREEQILPPGGTAGGGATTPDEAAGAGNETPEVHVAGGPGHRSGAAHRSEHPAPLTAESVSQLGTFATLAGMIADMTGDDSLVYGNPDMVEGPGGPGYQYLIGGPGIGGYGGPNMVGAGRGTCIGTNCGQGTIASGPLGTSGDVGPGGIGVGTERPMHRVGRVPGGLTPGPVTTTAGGLSREDIRRTVRRHINEVRFCYEQELISRPDLEGRVAVQFVVNTDGTVGSSAVVQQSGPVGDVGSCVSQSVRRWTFPASEGPTSVTYPFVLQSPE